jgi:hypothetical protein
MSSRFPRRWIPALGWLRAHDRIWLRDAVLVGVTLGDLPASRDFEDAFLANEVTAEVHRQL